MSMGPVPRRYRTSQVPETALATAFVGVDVLYAFEGFTILFATTFASLWMAVVALILARLRTHRARNRLTSAS
jgi:hypothetical protein